MLLQEFLDSSAGFPVKIRQPVIFNVNKIPFRVGRADLHPCVGFFNCFYLKIWGDQKLVVEPTHLKNIGDHFPKDQGEHNKYLKPPPSDSVSGTIQAVNDDQVRCSAGVSSLLPALPPSSTFWAWRLRDWCSQSSQMSPCKTHGFFHVFKGYNFVTHISSASTLQYSWFLWGPKGIPDLHQEWRKSMQNLKPRRKTDFWDKLQ